MKNQTSLEYDHCKKLRIRYVLQKDETIQIKWNTMHELWTLNNELWNENKKVNETEENLELEINVNMNKEISRKHKLKQILSLKM